MIALIALFVYDIFWVFFSSSFFADNVMVAVATKKADNPAQVGDARSVSYDSWQTSFELDLSDIVLWNFYPLDCHAIFVNVVDLANLLIMF